MSSMRYQEMSKEDMNSASMMQRMNSDQFVIIKI